MSHIESGLPGKKIMEMFMLLGKKFVLDKCDMHPKKEGLTQAPSLAGEWSARLWHSRMRWD